MQFHLNGFEPGDPEISDPAQRYAASGGPGTVPEEVDTLIVGCGPAGLTLAAQLSAFPDIKTCIVEQKSGPLLRGQADGIACRTMEMFEAYGFSERVLKEACWINETTFWKPDGKKRENIVRSGRVQDTEDGLSEFPHVVLNQAWVHDFFLDVMRKSPARLEPHYARRLLDLRIDSVATAGTNAYPYQVTAGLERLDGGRIVITGEDVTSFSPTEWESIRGNPVAMVFQDPSSFLNPVIRVGRQIAESVRRHDRVAKTDDRVAELLELVRLPWAAAHAYPNELSGGMQQRALLAIALGCRPRLLVADEPTTALDVHPNGNPNLAQGAARSLGNGHAAHKP